jgi:hypothetical protein
MFHVSKLLENIDALLVPHLEQHIAKTLNPNLWEGKSLKEPVRETLLRIARKFQDFIGVPLTVKDIILTGSMANYNYTLHSDVDLHLVAEVSDPHSSVVEKELGDAKKFEWNTKHHILIYGHTVELYLQSPKEVHHSSGIFSLLTNAWVKEPTPYDKSPNMQEIQQRVSQWVRHIDATIRQAKGDPISLQSLKKRLKRLRQAGLDRDGELSDENLIYKDLRDKGYLTKVVNALNRGVDSRLSLPLISEIPKGPLPTATAGLAGNLNFR